MHTAEIHTNDLVWWTQTTRTHTRWTCTIFTPDKALSKDNKPGEFRNISESHNPCLATSSERTADISVHVTTVKCPVKRCNGSIISEWDKEGKHCPHFSIEISSRLTRDVDNERRNNPSSLSVLVSADNILLIFFIPSYLASCDTRPLMDAHPDASTTSTNGANRYSNADIKNVKETWNYSISLVQDINPCHVPSGEEGEIQTDKLLLIILITGWWSGTGVTGVTCYCVSHYDNSGKANPRHFSSATPPAPIASDPSFYIHNHRPNYPRPFQVAGRWAPMCRCRFATSRLITREGTTSEHCVEFPRHTGKERKCSLSFHRQSYPPSLLNSNPQRKQSLGGYAVSNPRGFWGEREDTTAGGKTTEQRGVPPHLLTLFLSYMMPDVLRCCATIAMMLEKTHVRTHLPVRVIHSCCHSQLCEPKEQDFPTRHRELITCEMSWCLS